MKTQSKKIDFRWYESAYNELKEIAQEIGERPADLIKKALTDFMKMKSVKLHHKGWNGVGESEETRTRKINFLWYPKEWEKVSRISEGIGVLPSDIIRMALNEFMRKEKQDHL